MNEMQRKFFEHIAYLQDFNVQSCLAKHKISDPKIESLMYDVTYNVITDIFEMIDGYSGFSKDKHDIINTVTKEHLKENPFIELHDQTEEFLKTE